MVRPQQAGMWRSRLRLRCLWGCAAMSRRHRERVRVLDTARHEFCGIGTRRTKLALNRLAKTSNYAKALRVALEVEDKNLTAKKYHGGDIGGYSYDQIAYFAKHDGIMKLIQICKAQGWTFGIHKAGVFGATHVVYFDLPGVNQISWHFTPPADHELPPYAGVWDYQENSTLRKLEVAITPLVSPGAVMVADRAPLAVEMEAGMDTDEGCAAA